MVIALVSISTQQANPTENTMKKVKLFLYYAATHPEAISTFRVSNMTLAIHSNASYILETKPQSRSGCHFFMSDNA